MLGINGQMQFLNTVYNCQCPQTLWAWGKVFISGGMNIEWTKEKGRRLWEHDLGFSFIPLKRKGGVSMRFKRASKHTKILHSLSYGSQWTGKRDS